MHKKHSKIRIFLSVAACRFTRFALRVLHRGGTTLPGRSAMFFDKTILEVVSRDMEIIVVTGTNGKTTTCSMLRHALASAKINVLSNLSGANLLTGITAEFTANASLLGHPKKHYAIVECDEGALRKVVPYLNPKCIVVTNLFRDQLDRYGEVMHTHDVIAKGIKLVPKTKLVLNADDSLTASLGENVPNPVEYYGINVPYGKQEMGEISDAKYCIHCGTEYKYNYHTYAHLGDFYCPKCGYKRQTPSIAVTAIDKIGAHGSVVTSSINGKETSLHVGLPALYNVYNALAAVTAFDAVGFNKKYILRSLSQETSSFGRMETFNYKNTDMQMILVKNPAGCNQSISYMTSLGEDYTGVFCLNDKTADGHDISWIWDADHEFVAEDPHCKHIFVWGTRSEDMQLRLKYAGVPEDMITRVETPQELIDACADAGRPTFILPNYTPMIELRAVRGEATGKKEFWKEQA